MDTGTCQPLDALGDEERGRVLDSLASDGAELGLLLLELGEIALTEGKTKLANNLFNSALYQECARGRPGGEVAVASLSRLVDTAVKMRDKRDAYNWASRLVAVAPDDKTRKAAQRRAARLRAGLQREMEGTPGASAAQAPRTVADHPLTAFEPGEAKLTLTDVGGLSDAKNALARLAILPHRHPESAKRFGIKAGGGVLLYGPPGCGKTLLAEAAAGEMGVPIIRVKASEVLHPLYGMAERNLTEAFETARRSAPCVLLIDEIDGIAQRRDTDFYHRSLVNMLLVEMEASAREEGVLLVAATNQIDRIDAAMLRPGRFDKLVPVGVPDTQARLAIWKIQLAKYPTSERVDVNLLVELSEGLTGADIAEVATAAAEAVWMQSLDEGSDREVCLADLLISLRRGFVDGPVKRLIDEALSADLRGQVDGEARTA